MIKLHDAHPPGYVPLWKQWMKTEDYKHFLKHELPLLVKRTATIDGLTQHQREEMMAKEFQLRWMNSQTGKVEESKYASENRAKEKARNLSHEHSPVQVGEVDGGKLLQQWNYEKGRQQAMNTKKQVTVAPISKKEASAIETNERNTTMASKTNKTSQKKANGKAKEATTVAPKAKSQPLPKSSGQEPKKTGTVRDQFGLREGSNRAKLVDALLAAKGKPVAISGLLKAVYGNTKEEGKSALNMVLKGMSDMIVKNKIKMQIVRERDEKGGTIALKSK